MFTILIFVVMGAIGNSVFNPGNSNEKTGAIRMGADLSTLDKVIIGAFYGFISGLGMAVLLGLGIEARYAEYDVRYSKPKKLVKVNGVYNTNLEYKNGKFCFFGYKEKDIKKTKVVQDKNVKIKRSEKYNPATFIEKHHLKIEKEPPLKWQFWIVSFLEEKNYTTDTLETTYVLKLPLK